MKLGNFYLLAVFGVLVSLGYAPTVLAGDATAGWMEKTDYTEYDPPLSANLAWEQSTGNYDEATIDRLTPNVLSGVVGTFTAGSGSAEITGTSPANWTDGVIATCGYRVANNSSFKLILPSVAPVVYRFRSYEPAWNGRNLNTITSLTITHSDDTTTVINKSYACTLNNARSYATLAATDGNAIAKDVKAITINFGAQQNNGGHYAEFELEGATFPQPPSARGFNDMHEVDGKMVGCDRLEVTTNAKGVEGEVVWVFYAKTRAELEGEEWKSASFITSSEFAEGGVATIFTDALESNTDYFLMPVFENDDGFARGEIIAYKSMQKVIGELGKGGRVMLVEGEGFDIVHEFASAGEYEFVAPSSGLTRVEYLIVAGGGGGGGSSHVSTYGGGGGGGNVLTGAVVVAGGDVLSLTIGAGGAGRSGNTRGDNGGDSALSNPRTGELLVALGGGGGGSTWGGSRGRPGGNGGGGGGSNSGGAATASNGFAGGSGGGTSGYRGGGGGGAGGVGGAASGNNGGNGGKGLASSITGTERLYGGGGAGGGSAGGSYEGGGGAMGAAGTDGLGGGGGGAKTSSAGGAGGSGIIFLRYTPIVCKVAATVLVTNETAQSATLAFTALYLEDDGGLADVDFRYAVRGETLGAWKNIKTGWALGEEFDWEEKNVTGGFEYDWEVRVSSGGDSVVYAGRFLATGVRPEANGADVRYSETDDGWCVYTFRTNGTFAIPAWPMELEYLIVGGGGAGGGDNANYTRSGGGGGGYAITGSVDVCANAVLTVEVGAGGKGVANSRGEDGKDSWVTIPGNGFVPDQTLLALGGGGGGSANNGSGWYRGTGGGGGNNGGSERTYSSVGLTSKLGGNGGAGQASNNTAGGGGGGAVEDGGKGSGGTGGKGGDGLMSAITGEPVWYGGGGGGAGTTGGVGGKGGGGNGGNLYNAILEATENGMPGEDGFGGGGGGYVANNSTGVRGGSGVVILRCRRISEPIVASVAVTNREIDGVVFDCRLAQLGGGDAEAEVKIVYWRTGDSNKFTNVVAVAMRQGEQLSCSITGLSAATDYEYVALFDSPADHLQVSGTFTTMGIHGTGGEIHELEGGWIYHVFNEDETFVAPPMPIELEYLLVGGGGGGGGCSANNAYRGGGGGGGQVVTGRWEFAASQECLITIGQGGKHLGDNARGGDGTDSMVEIIGDVQKLETNELYIAYGGGGGGNGNYGGGWYRGTGGGGGNRGSGGTYSMDGVKLPEKRGGSGGNGYNSNNSAGGGGGAGADGANSPSDGTGGNGGDGIESFITGESVWYGGGGGGGGGNGTGGAGGKGGGGHGYRRNDPRNDTDLGVGHGVDGLGGGGGGYGNAIGGSGGNGGRGVVILRYRALAGEIFADFAVTNRETSSVTFKGELAALAGGEEAVNIYFCYAQVGGATNEWELIKEDWEPTDGFSYTLWPLAAGTDYLYFFKLQGEHFEKIFEGRVSTMSLHGTGGEIHELPDGWFYHSFTNNGVFVAPCDDLEVEYLVVGGGGGGGGCHGNSAYRGGGGGGGQAVTGKVMLAAFQECRITIGQGGKYVGDNARGDDGGDSFVEVVGDAQLLETNRLYVAYGGGGGGNGNTGNGWYRGTGGGGGSNYNSTRGEGLGGTPSTIGLSNAEKRGGSGGNGSTGNSSAGGGGGAGGDGFSAPSNGTGGAGGDGIESFITGKSVWYGGGGGGGGDSGLNGAGSGGVGGKGGGGHGYRRNNPRDSKDLGVGHGVDGLGGGGGGYGSATANSGGNGGSGIVIVRYRAPAEGVYAKIGVSKRESRAMNFALKMSHLPITDPVATVSFKFAYHDNATESLEELDWQDKGCIVEDFQKGDSESYRLDGIKAGHHFTGIFTVETTGGLKRAYTNDFATLGLVGGGGELHEIGDGWYYHSFTNNGVFVAPEADVELEYLVVGGGGAGGSRGSYAGGGGGGGAVVTGSVVVAAYLQCPVTVGIGGIAMGDNVTRCGSDSNFLVPGENADLDQNFTALGGGGGGASASGAAAGNGLSRGTGGGGAADGTGGTGSQGYNGGKGVKNNGGGGGGGAGGAGANAASTSSGGKGGDGIMSTITGEEAWYGGGGGGSGDSDATTGAYRGGGGLGGKGGGGRGSNCKDPRSGADLYAEVGPGRDGFGGGGGGGYGRVGASGGCGVVIVRYRSPEDLIRGRVVINSIGAGYAEVSVETLADEGREDLHLFTAVVPSASLGGTIYWKDNGPTRKGEVLHPPLVKLTPETSYRIYAKIAAADDVVDGDGEDEGTGKGEDAAQFYIDFTTLPVGEMAETSVMEVLSDGTILQTFNADETFALPATAINTAYRYLVVGGGGAGGSTENYQAGGGGGGGYAVTGTVAIAASKEISVVVGAGGLVVSQDRGGNGGNSVLAIAGMEPLIGYGGGGGGRSNGGSGWYVGTGGGGGCQNTGKGGTWNMSGVDLPAKRGGNGGNGASGNQAAGGGGGAVEDGQAAQADVGGKGGDGLLSDITGLQIYYGGGGGGGGGTGGAGGKGGGGHGNYNYNAVGTNLGCEPGVDGLGGGGGGGKPAWALGANGGRGVVMLRHLPKGETAQPDYPVGSFMGVEVNSDGSLTLTAYTPWAGRNAEATALSLLWGTDRVNRNFELPLDAATQGVRTYRFDEIFKDGCDQTNEEAARLYLQLKWANDQKQSHATGVRDILVPLTVLEPLEPGLDHTRRTVNFQGLISVVGWGSSTVKVHYGAAANALSHTVELARADYGKAPFQYETGALPLNVDGDEIPTLYYQYETIEVADGREIRHYLSEIESVEVFEEPSADEAYIQEGLIANWDGELNAGAEQPHAAAPEKWVDLVAGRKFALSGVAAQAEAMVFDGTGFGTLASGDTAATFGQISNGTMEVVLDSNVNAAVISQDDGIRFALNHREHKIVLGTIAAEDASTSNLKLVSIVYTNGAPKTVYVNGKRATLEPAGPAPAKPATAIFKKHVPMTASGYQGSSALTRFPVLVRLSEAKISGFSYADCADGGADLRFTDAAGDYLPHEIDTWDASGESCIWVLLPTLSGKTTTFSMHWSPAAGATLPQNEPTDVWVDYVGVWHMSEMEGDTAYDSTKNHYDAVYSIPGGAGPVTDPSLGRIGGARLLTGGEFVTTATSLTSGGVQNLTNVQQFTPSGWFYSSVNVNAYYNFFKKTAGWGGAGWYLNTQNNLTTYNIIGGGTAILQYSGATFYQARFLHTATYNGKSFVLYRNGVQVASKGDGSVATESSTPLGLGGGITGYCDELRIYNGTESADRVKADYDAQVNADFVAFGAVETTDPAEDVPPECPPGAVMLGAGAGGYMNFVGEIRSIRLYDRPLSTEEIALNQDADRRRFVGNQESASSARAWTAVNDASGANAIEPFPYNILADARQELSAGTVSSPYTSPEMLVDGNINQGNGYGINTGATLTYTFPAVVETMFDLRIVNAGVSGRRSSNVTKVEAVDSQGRVFTLAGAAELNPTAGPIGYLWLRAADGSPIAYNVKKLIITFGTMENSWALFTEIEATGSPYDEVRVKKFAAHRRLYGEETQDLSVMVPTNAVTGAIYDPEDKDVASGDAYMTIYYSTDAEAITNEWTSCPSFAAAYDRSDRAFEEWAGPMLSETDYYLRAVYVRESAEGILTARSEVLKYVSVNLENTIFGEGGYIRMTTDNSGDIIHVFDTAGSGTFVAPYTEPVKLEYLVVGGGGAGANGTSGNPSFNGNGGGGGEAWTNEAPVVVERGEECQIAVGAGSPAPGTTAKAVSSRDGEPSSITINGEAVVARGGARATGFAGAGGDGRGGLNLHNNGTGGAGLKCDITGEMVGYAGGGCAGSNYASVDGGGAGGSASANASAGVRGGGGGGGNNTNAGKAAAGGDGVVIVRHPPTTAEMRATVETLEARAHFIGVSVRADVIIVDDPHQFREATAEVYFGFGTDPDALEYRLVCEALPLDATWTTNVVGLLPETDYCYGVIISNAATETKRKGAFYAREATTEPHPDPDLEPMITLVSVTSAVNRISADVLYDTTYAGLDKDYVDVYLLYGDKPDALGNERQIATNVVGYGLYNLDELKLNTNQYVQVFASNDTGKVWSEVKSVFLEAAPKIGDNCRTWWTDTAGRSGFAFTILDPGPIGCPGVSEARITLYWGSEDNEEALTTEVDMGDYSEAKEYIRTVSGSFPKTFYYRFKIENFIEHKTGSYNFFSYTPIFRGGGWTLKFNDSSTVAGTINDGDWIFNVAVARELITVTSVNKAGTDPKVDFAMPVATEERKYFIDAIGNDCFSDNSTTSEKYKGRQNLGSLLWPDDLTAIGNNAFRGCATLEWVAPIPSGVKAIGDNAFNGCTRLAEVVLLGAERIGASAFYGDSSLTNVVALCATNLASQCFANNAKLASLTFGSGAVLCDNANDNGVIATGAAGKGFELHFGCEPFVRSKGKAFKCIISGQAADPCRIFVDSPRAIERWRREVKTAEVTDSDLKVADKYGIRREWVFGIYQDKDSGTPRHLLINGTRIPLVIKVK